MEHAISTRLLSVTYLLPKQGPFPSVAGSKQNPKIPGWKEVRSRGQWDLCKTPSLLLCPLIHLPACQETAYIPMQRSIKVTTGLGWVFGQSSNINE